MWYLVYKISKWIYNTSFGCLSLNDNQITEHQNVPVDEPYWNQVFSIFNCWVFLFSISIWDTNSNMYFFYLVDNNVYKMENVCKSKTQKMKMFFIFYKIQTHWSESTKHSVKNEMISSLYFLPAEPVLWVWPLVSPHLVM